MQTYVNLLTKSKQLPLSKHLPLSNPQKKL